MEQAPRLNRILRLKCRESTISAGTRPGLQVAAVPASLESKAFSMVRMPAIRGRIRRRILVNFRVDPEVMRRQLPAPFRPKLLGTSAVAGLCLIRLEGIRPALLPTPLGLNSENAAHRVAVVWDEDTQAREAVWIPRRDSNSLLAKLVGGRWFPGEHRTEPDLYSDYGAPPAG